MQRRLAAAGLSDIAEKLSAGIRLDLEDGVRLFEAPDLLAVGWLANRERERRHGALTYFNYNIRLATTAPIRCRSIRRGTSCGSAPISRSPRSTSSMACTPICRSTTTRSCCEA